MDNKDKTKATAENKKKDDFNKAENSRRDAMKKILLGSGAVAAAKSGSDAWQKPAIDSIILPAHAQTSPPVGATP